MKGVTTGKTSKRKSSTDWEALRCMSDADIRAGIESDPDAQVTDEDFWTFASDSKTVRGEPVEPHF